MLLEIVTHWLTTILVRWGLRCLCVWLSGGMG